MQGKLTRPQLPMSGPHQLIPNHEINPENKINGSRRFDRHGWPRAIHRAYLRAVMGTVSHEEIPFVVYHLLPQTSVELYCAAQYRQKRDLRARISRLGSRQYSLVSV